MRKTHDILLETRAALPTLTASSERKNAALLAIAERLLSEQEEILSANREDIEASRDRYGEVPHCPIRKARFSAVWNAPTVS